MSDNSNSFGFPFEPYTIQNDFMKELYTTLDQDKIGIFESPTGTGKSLSLICGSLKWLQDRDHEKLNQKLPLESLDDEPDWVTAFQGSSSETRKVEEKNQRKRDLIKRVEHVRNLEKNEEAIELAAKNKNGRKRFKKDDAEEDFLVDDYSSDNEQENVQNNGSYSHLSKEVRELLQKFETKKTKISYHNDDIEEDDDLFETKVFYASRTHSQLTQFVHEINKTVYGNHIFEVSLGSRKNLCINKDVNKLKSVHRINEACLDMQKKGSKTGPCSFLPPVDSRHKWDQFRDHAIAKVRDIEELVSVGKRLSTCPYYGSRNSLKSSQLVVLPYQHLLHASTREALGISLKNSVVIIDEAHNLIETITSLHTVSLSLVQIQLTWNQLSLYIQKYKERLLGKNVVYIKQILNVLKTLLRHLQASDSSEKKDSITHVNEFLHKLSIDHLNMYKIKSYLEKSNLARKLNGFIDKAKEKEEEKRQSMLSNASSTDLDLPSLPHALTSSIPTITQVESFLLALTNPDKDGRIVTSFGNAENPGVSIKYMLLNPADAFKPVVDDAKSIILAGGTMEPVSDFFSHLFPTAPKERLAHFSYGHIVPPSNLLTLTLGCGSTGKPFVFNFENRQDTSLIDETGLAIANLCNVIPDGVICFFPSFTYLEQMYSRWKERGILKRIEARKKVFKEPKEGTKIESTLREYSAQISQENNQGALILCVVNGKMSEGINFSDRLGRGVIMIGLPFANRSSVELQEKMNYAKKHASATNNHTDGGMEYYENLCMRGVNQSIGRAIRHKGDYATIILLDKRYATERIQKKLPKWIGDHIEHVDVFGKAMGRTSVFFRNKKKNQ